MENNCLGKHKKQICAARFKNIYVSINIIIGKKCQYKNRGLKISKKMVIPK